MLGLTKSELENTIEFRVRGTMIVLTEYQGLEQLVDRIVEGVAEAIEKNNIAIEDGLRSHGIDIKQE
jgi:hypothetical protein